VGGLRATVIIPSWNAGDVLGRCLDSLERQEVEGGFETIVVDNGSTDGTAELLRQRNGRVRAIVNDRNEGYSTANNQAARIARGSVLVLLNSDTELLAPDTLERLCRTAEEPGVGLAGPLLVNPDGSLQPSCAAHPTVLRSLVVGSGLHRFLPQGLRLRVAPEFWAHDRPADTGWLLGAAVAIRADLFAELGGLWPHEYAEDEDLAYRVEQRGLRVRFDDSARIMHVGNHTLGKHRTDSQRATRIAEAELAFLRAHYSRSRAAAIRAVVGCAYAARAVAHTLLRRPERAAVFRVMASVYARRPAG
jgi:N-acetylglucosaminyl-diphospho-decaprenol L-rhamnosyltransferase